MTAQALTNDAEEGLQASNVEQVVTFLINGEELAINIMQVKEIIKFTEIRQIPKAPEYVVGVVSLRNNLLPIFNLRKKFRYLEKERDVANVSQRVVVVEYKGMLVGILVDSVAQVISIDKSEIESAPAILNNSEVDFIKGIAKLEKGNRIILILDVLKLFDINEDFFSTDMAKSLDRERSVEKIEANAAEEVQIVCFKIGKEEYGFNIMRVQEIIRLREITNVPQSLPFMEGILNLRGSVVPVLDIRKRLNLEKIERADSNRIIIINLEGTITGVIVDSVSEVIRISKSFIEQTPSNVADIKDKFISGVGKLNQGKRIVVLINAEQLLGLAA